MALIKDSSALPPNGQPSQPVQAAQPMPPAAPRPTGPFSGRYVFVTIHRDGGSDGKEDVPLAVEGRVLKIKRGERVRIPIEHYQRLTQCLYDTTDQYGEVVGQIPRVSCTFHGEDTPPAAKAA